MALRNERGLAAAMMGCRSAETAAAGRTAEQDLELGAALLDIQGSFGTLAAAGMLPEQVQERESSFKKAKELEEMIGGRHSRSSMGAAGGSFLRGKKPHAGPSSLVGSFKKKPKPSEVSV